MNETFFHFFSCLIRMIVCWFTFSSFFLSLIEREKKSKIDWLMEEASCWSLMNFYYFSLFNWLIDRNQFYFFFHFWMNEWNQLMTTDILALVSMKNAAKCEKPCELHNTWIIKSLNASGAWEVASKHVCLRVVFIIANYFFFSFFHLFTFVIDWLIWKRELFRFQGFRSVKFFAYYSSEAD